MFQTNIMHSFHDFDVTNFGTLIFMSPLVKMVKDFVKVQHV